MVTPDFWGGERVLRLNESPMSNDLMNHDYVMMPL